MKKQGYNYNIFISTYQKDDSFFQNLIRKIQFHKTLVIILRQYGVSNATIFKNIGLYEGKKEKCYLIHIITDKNKTIMKDLCKELRAINNQNSVLLQVINTGYLIFPDGVQKLIN